MPCDAEFMMYVIIKHHILEHHILELPMQSLSSAAVPLAMAG